MSIFFFNEDVPLPVFSKSKISKWITRCIIDENHQVGTINFIFVSDNYLLEMNRQYLNHDYFTDVISFDYCEGKTVSGDVFMSVDRIRENASDLELNFTDELFRVMIHGVLHFMGYHDKTDEEKKQMRAKEDEALKKIE